MNLILKRDPVWLESLQLHNPIISTLLLLGGDGQQVAVPAPLMLAASPLVRSILSDLLPPAFSPCILSLPGATEEILHVMVNILATGTAGGEHLDKMEDVKQVFRMLGVTVSLVSYQVDRRQADPDLDIGDKVEDSSEVMDIPLDEKNIKLEIIVKTEAKDADVEKPKAIRKRFTPQILASNSVKVSCTFCPQKLTNKQNLRKHIRSIHEKVKHSCKLCPQKYTQSQDLVRHIRSVHDQIKFPCNLCPQKFTRQRNLVKHINSVHDQIQFECKLCPKMFKQKSNLVTHIKSVHNQIKILCQLCPQKFIYKSSLERHVKSVHESIKFSCNLCSQKFTQNRNLVNHVKSIHEKIKSGQV